MTGTFQSALNVNICFATVAIVKVPFFFLRKTQQTNQKCRDDKKLQNKNGMMNTDFRGGEGHL